MQKIFIRFLARHTDIAASALRCYKTRGLLNPQRNRAGQRRYPRSDIRRFSIVIIVQKCGFRLRDIKELIGSLPQNRSPTTPEWASVSQVTRGELNRKSCKKPTYGINWKAALAAVAFR